MEPECAIILQEDQSEALLRSLTCCLCSSRFSEPKECPCGHVFCLDCLLTYFENHDGATSAECPSCDRILTIPEGGLGALPTHVFYRDLVKKIKRINTSNNKVSRGSCKFCDDQEKQVACVKCVVCQATMCELCSANHAHNGVTNVVAIHRRQDSILCDILPQRESACQLHDTETLLFYCSSCSSCVCYKCRSDNHAEHNVADLADTVIPAKTSIADVQGKLRDYLTETREAISDIERISKDYSENVLTAKQQIEANVQRMIDYLCKERDRLLSEITSHAKDIQHRLADNEKEMQSKDARAKAMADLTENLLVYGNDAENTAYKRDIEDRWHELQKEKLNRFGQGYKMSMQFFMNDGISSFLNKELGRYRVTQNLSPWTARKSNPFEFAPPNNGTLMDAEMLHKHMRSAISNDFSLQRSKIFSRFVDPKWSLETFKTSKSTGQTVTAWLRADEDQEQASRASKRLSMRSNSSPSLMLEVESFNVKGEQQYRKRFEKLPDGTIVRLALGGKDTILLAVYPGLYASSIISQAKLKSLSKKETDGIYVAVLQNGNFMCGELRKVPIPEGPGFDFDITSRGVIAIKPALSPDLKIYSTLCNEVITDHGSNDLTIKKLMESPEHETVVVCFNREGELLCETVSDKGEREARFKFSIGHMFYPMPCLYKDACFDRFGNLLVHMQVGGKDYLLQVASREQRVEFLAKPDMLQKVDKVAVLPDGRLCLFDRTECVLMNLKYLAGS